MAFLFLWYRSKTDGVLSNIPGQGRFNTPLWGGMDRLRWVRLRYANFYTPHPSLALLVPPSPKGKVEDDSAPQAPSIVLLRSVE